MYVKHNSNRPLNLKPVTALGGVLLVFVTVLLLNLTTGYEGNRSTAYWVEVDENLGFDGYVSAADDVADDDSDIIAKSLLLDIPAAIAVDILTLLCSCFFLLYFSVQARAPPQFTF